MIKTFTFIVLMLFSFGSGAEVYQNFLTLAQTTTCYGMDAVADTLALGCEDNKLFLYSVSTSAITFQETLSDNGGKCRGVGISSDGITLFNADSSSGGRIYKRANTGLYTSHQNITAADAQTGYQQGCISSDATFIAFGRSTVYEIHKLNTGSGFYQLYETLSSLSTATNCYFSDDNQYFFVGAVKPTIYKDDGTDFNLQKQITITAGSYDALVEFNNGYLAVTDEVSSNTRVSFYQKNSASSLWETNSNQLFTGNAFKNFALSDDSSFFGISIAANSVNKGSIAGGFSEVTSLESGAVKMKFSPNKQFYFSSYPNKLEIFINCNWNTSGNFYFNSNNNQCEQCPNCLNCGAGGTCNQCDQANKYFKDNSGGCALCSLSNCLTCSSLTACSVCDDGYQLENSECVEGMGGSGSLSIGMIAGIAGGGGAVLLIIVGLIIWKSCSGSVKVKPETDTIRVERVQRSSQKLGVQRSSSKLAVQKSSSKLAAQRSSSRLF